MRFLLIYLVIFSTISASAIATAKPPRSPYTPLTPSPLGDGELFIRPTLSDLETGERGPRMPLDVEVGNLYLAGRTWYDLQHNSSAGKMISVDNNGYVQLVWMNGFNAGQNPRHVFYNAWDPSTQSMLNGMGWQVDPAARAGYACQATHPDGWCFPAFHETFSTGSHSAAGMDFLPVVGAFTITEPAYLFESGTPLDIIWPKIAIGANNSLHVVSTHNGPTSPYRIYYSRGTPLWIDDMGLEVDWQPVAAGNAEFRQIDAAHSVTADIAASKISNRVAIAWTRVAPGSLFSLDYDLFLIQSEDGGLNWGPIVNVTTFADVDTFRADPDLSLIFDQADNLHIAFTSMFVNEPEGYGYIQESIIWHWDEASTNFSALAEAWFISLTANVSGSTRMACRPSLSVDPVTNYLYCSYQKYDTTHWSASEYFDSDVWMTVSTDGGQHWSVGRNLTDTHAAVNPAPAGQSRMERDITLADHVSYALGNGYLHLEWLRDYDAGAFPLGEGVATLNDVYYQRVPVTEIPLTPLLPNYSIHVDTSAGRCCYLVSGVWQCQNLPEADCQTLSGEWSAGLSCSAPCASELPLGRCCYGPPNHELCQYIYEADCAMLIGTWDRNLTCDTPCPTIAPCTCQDQPNAHCNLLGGPVADGSMIGTDFAINVPAQYHITDLNVCIEMLAPYTSSVEITLRSPAGTTIPLFTRRGSGSNLNCLTLDDEAPFSLEQGESPFNGSYRPEAPLSAFDGQNALGDWILHVTDTVSFNFDSLRFACLNFTYDRILPVELISFEAASEASGIRIEFETASETATDHFLILRATDPHGSFQAVATLRSEGSASAGHRYSYVNRDVVADRTYWYYLVDIALSGERTEHREFLSSASLSDAPIPVEFSLTAFPNPFNPTTTLQFSLPQAGPVEISIYNMSGELVRQLANRAYEAGTHSVEFSADALPSGLYFAKLSGTSIGGIEKLVLIK